MRTLSISSDRLLFRPRSEVRSRLLELAERVGELHVVVFAKRSLGFVVQQVGDKLFLYPTNSRNKLAYLSDAIRIGRRLARPDFVTAQDPFECGLVAWRLAKYFQTELHLQIHTDFLNPYFAKQSFLNQVRVIIAHWLLPKADRVRVVSQRIADSLKAHHYHLKTTPEVRPIAVDVEKIKNAAITVDLHQKYPEFKKIILMASRLTPEKNIGLALKAMKIIGSERREIGLIIVGSGPQKIVLTPNVVVEPWVDQATLYSYYKTADLFLLTSLFEGYGLTLVEANAAGCPIISTDVGVAQEVGAVIADFSPVDLAAKIVSRLQL